LFVVVNISEEEKARIVLGLIGSYRRFEDSKRQGRRKSSLRLASMWLAPDAANGREDGRAV
jgi:hypothetical protein